MLSIDVQDLVKEIRLFYNLLRHQFSRKSFYETLPESVDISVILAELTDPRLSRPSRRGRDEKFGARESCCTCCVTGIHSGSISGTALSLLVLVSLLTECDYK